MAYTKIGVQSDLPAPGEAKEFEVAGKTICVANVNGTCTAIDNVCLHMGGPLGQGFVENGKVVCPWHEAEFDLKTGDVLAPPAFEGVKSYKVVVEGHDVKVELKA